MPIPHSIQESLNAFRLKYYKSKILGGSVLLLLLVSSLFLTVVFGESLFNFSVTIRTIVFFLLIATFIGVGIWKILLPGLKILNIGKVLSNTEAALLIGKYIKEIDDKLLNVILLSKVSEEDNSLIQAAINSKAKEISIFPFTRAVSYEKHKILARYLIAPAVIVLALLIFNPDVLTQSSYRLVNFNTDFPPPPPFLIVLKDIPNEVEEGNDVSIEAIIQGKEIPSELFLYVNRKGSEDWVPIPLTAREGSVFNLLTPARRSRLAH